MSSHHAEAILIDADEEAEEEQEYLSDFAELQRSPSDGGEAKTETKVTNADTFF